MHLTNAMSDMVFGLPLCQTLGTICHATVHLQFATALRQTVYHILAVDSDNSPEILRTLNAIFDGPGTVFPCVPAHMLTTVYTPVKNTLCAYFTDC